VNDVIRISIIAWFSIKCPLLMSFVLSHAVLGKSYDSLCISKDVVPVEHTGTKEGVPSMDDSGMAYKACPVSNRS
jgi:hypothetical protein